MNLIDNECTVVEHTTLQDEQHSGADPLNILSAMFDKMNLEDLAKLVPSYRSGINPNYFEEYYGNLESSDLTNNDEINVRPCCGKNTHLAAGVICSIVSAIIRTSRRRKTRNWITRSSGDAL